VFVFNDLIKFKIMNTQSIQTFAQWKVKEGELIRVLALLSELTQRSKLEDGNLMYKVYQSATDPNVLILFESYKDQESIERHRNSTHFQELALKQIIPLLESREVNLTTELEF
jgi:(4S)-4-hydroxy-5-phosphonooxypentane-2,3-dione isomerase